MRSYSTNHHPWSDWCQSLMISAITFLVLACPIALTCAPSELVGWKRFGKKRITECLLSPDKSQAVVVVTSHSYSSQSANSSGHSHEITRSVRSLVACSLTSGAARSVALLEYPCLNCWGWTDQNGTMLMSNDRGQLLSFRAGTSRQAPKPLIELCLLRDVEVQPELDFILINDSGHLAYYKRGKADELSHPVWKSHPDVESFALLPESNRLVAVRRRDGLHQLYLLETETGQVIRWLASLPDQVDRIVVLPKSKQLLIVCGKVAGLLPWNITGDPTATQFVPWIRLGQSSLTAISPDERIVITTGSEASQLIAWCTKECRALMTYPNCETSLIGAEFLDSNRFVTWGTDNKLRIWNMNLAQVEREIVF